MNSALQQSSDHQFQLYDSQELLCMDSKVASGYLVLMGGYANNNINNTTTNSGSGGVGDGGGAPPPVVPLDPGALNLAFMALIEGNVIEACLGVKSHGGAGGGKAGTARSTSSSSSSERGMKLAKDAKTMISEAVQSSQSVQQIAVTAYGTAFQIVINYHKDRKKLNFITRCFKSKPIRRKAETALYETFKPLNEAIAAATQ